MTTTSPKIFIIGAGIGGLSCALAMSKFGIKAEIYEQAKQFARVGAGIQMAPNATKVLQGLGLLDILAKTSFEPSTNLNRAWDTGEITNEFALLGNTLEKYGSPFYALHRGDLHQAIASKIPKSQIHLGKKLIEVKERANDVALYFEDGTEVCADAVIGADGVHSLLREYILGPEAPRFTGRVAYRTTFPAHLLKHADIGQSRTKWWGPDRHIVIYYVTKKQDEIYFVTSQPEDALWTTPESWSAKGDLSMLISAYKGFHPDVQAVLAACPEVYKWALFDRDPLPRWTQDRILLVGDACHPMTPYMAQGATMALEDSVLLARCLHEKKHLDIAEIFKLFEKIRKPRTSKMQLGSSQNQWMQNSTNPDWVYGFDAWHQPLEAFEA